MKAIEPTVKLICLTVCNICVEDKFTGNSYLPWLLLVYAASNSQQQGKHFRNGLVFKEKKEE